MTTENPQTLGRLLTSKDDISRTRIESFSRPPLEEGKALLALERFALTANNLTYAAFGDAMRYWEFFPTGQEGWGLMPVWGFASVLESKSPGLEPGERFYGYFPMADVLEVLPGRTNERGFHDLTDYRQPMASPYNQYTRCATDPSYTPELEDHQMLLRPLFFTSYMLADMLEDSAFFNADQIIFSSASSKTAYGAAFCLQELPARPRLVALTSPGNREFVERLGLYDDVYAYPDSDRIPAVASAYIDFSGSTPLRLGIRKHLGDQLRRDCFVGSAANFDFVRESQQLDPAPTPFFAPNQIRKRSQEWGADLLAQRFGAIQSRFLEHVANPKTAWMRIESGSGYEDAARIIKALGERGGEPDVGYTVRV